MFPLLVDEDRIIYQKKVFSRIKQNDLILIYKNRRYFTHRVIYKTNRYIITKGDNNTQSDGKIYPRQIIAKVIKVKRGKQVFDPENIYLIQSTLYFQEIAKIKEEFEKKQIGFVFLKGLPVHLYYEGKHPHRIYADCDILIDRKNKKAVEKILSNYNYKKIHSELSLTQKNLMNKESELHYCKRLNGFNVMFDLHFEPVFMMTQLGKLEALYSQKLIDKLTQEFLTNKQTVTINSSIFPLLPSHLQITYLALHFFHHNFSGIFRLELIKNIIQKIPRKHQKKVQDDIVITLQRYCLGNYIYWPFILLSQYFPETKKFLYPILKAARPTDSKLRYLKALKISVFDDESRISSGIARFKNLFFLSPEPVWKRSMVFFNPQVVYSVLWVVYKRLFGRRK